MEAVAIQFSRWTSYFPALAQAERPMRLFLCYNTIVASLQHQRQRYSRCIQNLLEAITHCHCYSQALSSGMHMNYSSLCVMEPRRILRGATRRDAATASMLSILYILYSLPMERKFPYVSIITPSPAARDNLVLLLFQ